MAITTELGQLAVLTLDPAPAATARTFMQWTSLSPTFTNNTTEILNSDSGGWTGARKTTQHLPISLDFHVRSDRDEDGAATEANFTSLLRRWASASGIAEFSLEYISPAESNPTKAETINFSVSGDFIITDVSPAFQAYEVLTCSTSMMNAGPLTTTVAAEAS